MNPASIAECNETYTISIFSVNAGIDNNAATITNTGKNFRKLLHQQAVGVNDIFVFNNKASITAFGPYLDYRLPGLMFNIKQKHSFAITARIRAINQMNNFNRDVYHSLIDKEKPITVSNNNMDMSDFNWTLHAWTEIGFSYGGVLFTRGRHRVIMGFTAKYLTGILYSSMVSKQFAGKFNTEAAQLNFNADVSFASNMSTTPQSENAGVNISNNILSNNSGSGVGGDVGFIYEFKIDRESDQYKFKVSFAVNDMGAITYSNNNTIIHMAGDGKLNLAHIGDSIKNINAFTNYMAGHGLRTDTTNAAAKVHLPTAIVAGFDYNVNDFVFINLMYLYNIAGKNDFGNFYYDQISITPRYTTTTFSVGVPITYSFLSNKIKMGLGIRFNGFYIGSDDMMAFFMSNQTGINLYAGATIHIHPKLPKIHFKSNNEVLNLYWASPLR